MMADTAVAGERVGLVPAWAARIFAALTDRLAAEGDRRLLWLPVFFGAGIGIYFVLRVEPPLWPGVAAAIAGAGLSFALRRHPAWCETALALTVFAAGFALMGETAWERQAPMLQRHLGPVTLTGRVVDIDLAQKGWRIVVEPDPLAGLDPAGQPRRVRLQSRGRGACPSRHCLHLADRPRAGQKQARSRLLPARQPSWQDIAEPVRAFAVGIPAAVPRPRRKWPLRAAAAGVGALVAIGFRQRSKKG
jgi:hypothetical protein